MTAPVRYRSYSQLKLYLECPAQYRWKYVEKLPEQPSIWSAGGTAFHAVAERIVRGEELDLDDAWDEAWQEAVTDLITRGADPDLATWRAAKRGREDAPWWWRTGRRMVRDFQEWWTHQVDSGQLVALRDQHGPILEREFLTEIGGVPVRAIPDALVVDENGNVVVLDYKSGAREPEGSLQLGVYAAAVEVALGVKAHWGLYFMTRQVEAVPRALTAWTPEVIGEMFADFDTREKAGEYPAKPGPHCRFCPARDLCPEKIPW